MLWDQRGAPIDPIGTMLRPSSRCDDAGVRHERDATLEAIEPTDPGRHRADPPMSRTQKNRDRRPSDSAAFLGKHNVWRPCHHDQPHALSHPDCTVGSGISPDRARATSCARSRAFTAGQDLAAIARRPHLTPKAVLK